MKKYDNEFLYSVFTFAAIRTELFEIWGSYGSREGWVLLGCDAVSSDISVLAVWRNLLPPSLRYIYIFTWQNVRHLTSKDRINCNVRSFSGGVALLSLRYGWTYVQVIWLHIPYDRELKRRKRDWPPVDCHHCQFEGLHEWSNSR